MKPLERVRRSRVIVIGTARSGIVHQDVVGSGWGCVQWQRSELVNGQGDSQEMNGSYSTSLRVSSCSKGDRILRDVGEIGRAHV